MKKWVWVLLCLMLFSACGLQNFPNTTAPPTQPSDGGDHSGLYIPGLSVEDVLRYFNEVVLDAEFASGGGDPTKVQKWVTPIYYTLYAGATEKDRQVLGEFAEYLNTIQGFPGIFEADNRESANMHIYFRNKADMADLMGQEFLGMEGGVTYWYHGDNTIYQAKICYRTDISQKVRNSVLLEEIYNGLGPVQDTTLREDSILYAHTSTNLKLSAVDALILKLLYSPEILCGMTAEECEEVIRRLYY